MAVIWIEHVVRALVETVDRLICLAGGRIIGDGAPDERAREPGGPGGLPWHRGDRRVLLAEVAAVGPSPAVEHVRPIDGPARGPRPHRAPRPAAGAERREPARSATGEVYAIIGANGAGKSTLLRAIAGLHAADERAASCWTASTSRSCSPERPAGGGIALVPEGRRLFPSLTVEENLLVGAHRARPGPWTIERVYELFPWMRERRDQRAAQLSGGEQQAVAIGRALVDQPARPAARRAVARARADRGSADLRPPAGAARDRHARSWWSSRTSARRCAWRPTSSASSRAARRCAGRPTSSRHSRSKRPTSGSAERGRRAHGRGRGMIWINALIQGVLLGGLYALFALRPLAALRRDGRHQPRPRRPGRRRGLRRHRRHGDPRRCRRCGVRRSSCRSSRARLHAAADAAPGQPRPRPAHDPARHLRPGGHHPERCSWRRSRPTATPSTSARW